MVGKSLAMRGPDAAISIARPLSLSDHSASAPLDRRNLTHACWRKSSGRSGRSLSEFTRDLACGDELLEGGLGARKESFAGFGQADTARCAYEQRCADAHLKCAYRLANRRWTNPEFRGRSAKTAVLGNAQECLHAVERALPDCEVLLHSLSTLSRIVGRGKRSY